MKVRIQKLSAVENPVVETATRDEYTPGQYTGEKSVFVNYEVEGHITHLPCVGENIFMQRTSRNGVEVFGFFQTSMITHVEGDIFHTTNSIYRITEIK